MSKLTRRIKQLQFHSPLLIIVLGLYLALAFAFSTWAVPLGEAPDEPAHLNYARFITEKGRLPTTLDERQGAGYRSAWPPLYHFLISRPLAAIGDTPPTHLKSVGDTPRRLIPTNGQTIAAFIHTNDEAWPWRGITLAWHLGRLISVALTTLTIIFTYLIAWRLTYRCSIATATAALVAFIPQLLFVGSVVNDDSLLITLSSLNLLLLVIYSQRPTLPGIGSIFTLGLVLGLATVSKYNALPLWGIALVWLGWLIWGRYRGNMPKPTSAFLARLAGLLLGAAITAGWWFVFIWRNFNQVDTLGWIRGSLAALTAATADASLRQIADGNSSVNLPPPGDWLNWFVTLFQSFWGRFGGGGTIHLPGWAYWLLFVLCLVAAMPYIVRIPYSVKKKAQRATHHAPKNQLFIPSTSLRTNLHSSPLAKQGFILFLSPFFFLILPLTRFILTGSIPETAQGRHLFPALPAIALALIWGVAQTTDYILYSKLKIKNSPSNQRLPTIKNLPPLLLPLLPFIFSIYALFLIQSKYPPLIPLRTTPDAAISKNLINTKLTDSINLFGYEVRSAMHGILPTTLVWEAKSIPAQDYVINLTLTGDNGAILGNWLGQPVGGRYPTRAWDKRDILRDTIPMPLLPDVSASNAALTLQLLDTQLRPASDPLELRTGISVSNQSSHMLAGQLRADGLSPDEPFTYRNTISFVLPDVTRSPSLITPDNQSHPPVQFISGPNGSIVHFMVEAYWPGGAYRLSPASDSFPLIPIKNRLRQFQPPPMAHTLNTNFADHITLLGYDLPQRRVEAGGTFPLTLHLRANRTMGESLVIFNHLLDAKATQHGGADRIPQQYYNTLLWIPGEIVSDYYQVPVDADAPPGIYRLDVGFYPDDQPTLSLPLVIDGQFIDRNSVQIGPIKVGGPPPGVTTTEAQTQHRLNSNFGDQITLLGFNLTDMDNNPPQLTLFWQADTIPTADYTVFIHLLDAEDNLAAQFDSPPTGGAYPTSLWDSGEIIIDQRHLNDLPPGHYTVNIGLYQPDTGERLPITGSNDDTLKLTEIEIAP